MLHTFFEPAALKNDRIEIKQVDIRTADERQSGDQVVCPTMSEPQCVMP